MTPDRTAASVTLMLLAATLLGMSAGAAVPEAGGAGGHTGSVEAPHIVTMGAVDPELPDASPRPPAGPGRLDRFEYLAYYPDRLRIHRGDTVRFRRDGFHTVTFSPEGVARGGFVRRDELAGVAAEGSRQPSDPSCGTPAAPCLLTGTAQEVNSGWRDLTVTVDLPVGSYDYYCMIHEGMEGTVEVVADDRPVPSAAEVAEERRSRIAADTAAGAALLAANQTPDVEIVGAAVRWTVKVGDITRDDRVAVLRFMPGSLEVAPGDEVEFVVPGEVVPPPGRSELATELHTVTFPHDVVAQFALLRYFSPACDPDDPAAGAPGVPGLYPTLITGCPPGATSELLFQPWAWTAPARAPGDAVVTPITAHDSGLLTREGVACRSSCDPWTEEPFPSRTRARFPAEGSFSYVCLVHPEMGMAGSVTVVGG